MPNIAQHKSSRSRRDHSRRSGTSDILSEIPVALIAFAAIVVPCVAVPFYYNRWHAAKGLLVELIAIVLLAILAYRFRISSYNQIVQELKRTPLTWFAALLVWSGLSIAWSASERFSILGFLNRLTGLAIATAVAYFIRSRRRVLYVLDSLIVGALLITVLGLIKTGEVNSRSATDILGNIAALAFPDHQLFGSLCMLLLPIMLAAALSPVETVHRLGAQCALIFCALSLLMAQDRSSWIAEFFALTVFVLLWLRWRPVKAPSRKRSQPQGNLRSLYLPYILLGTVAAAVLIAFLSGPTTLAMRVKSLTNVTHGNDLSFEWRLRVWKSELKMIRERPLLGRGVGNYAYVQNRFTGVGQDSDVVGTYGPTLNDEGHNSYLQLAVDLGLPGLALWLLAVASLLVYGLRAIGRLSPGSTEQWLVLGCVSAVVGQSVDSLANPSWQFQDILLYFWIVAGLILAIAGKLDDRMEDPADTDNAAAGHPSTGVAAFKLSLIVAVAAWLAYEAISTAVLLPIPCL